VSFSGVAHGLPATNAPARVCYLSARVDEPLQVSGDDSPIYPDVVVLWTHDGSGRCRPGVQASGGSAGTRSASGGGGPAVGTELHVPPHEERARPYRGGEARDRRAREETAAFVESSRPRISKGGRSSCRGRTRAAATHRTDRSRRPSPAGSRRASRPPERNARRRVSSVPPPSATKQRKSWWAASLPSSSSSANSSSARRPRAPDTPPISR
jgi:hypothetical protein